MEFHPRQMEADQGESEQDPVITKNLESMTREVANKRPDREEGNAEGDQISDQEYSDPTIHRQALPLPKIRIELVSGRGEHRWDRQEERKFSGRLAG